MVEPLQKQLREIGLRLSVEVVRDAVERLALGGSLYALYSTRDGRLSLMGKGTAVKIRDLWKEGKLRFLLEVPPEKQDIDISGENARTAESPGPMPLGWKATATHYAAIMEEMPSVEWSIRGLEASGVTSEEALALLLEYDSLA
ncbi:MAG: hypothetical protein Q8P22_01420, partial [Chloroflexota bacterium]|nr:hypothetical protein [Chloroflexota bacterium]